MKYFKIVPMGFEEEYIPITQDELDKAIYVHRIGNIVGVFDNGSITGTAIRMVVPDFHTAMGWNRGYKLQAEDYSELKSQGVQNEYDGLISEAKFRVDKLIQARRTDLI